jgi:hypothetical protein
MEIEMRSNLKIIIAGFLLLTLFPIHGYSMKVTFFLGKSVLTRNGKTVNLKVGDNVSSGDIIKTSKNGIVELQYDDTSKITIKGDTIVQIGNKHIKGSGDVAVISGQVTGKFVKLKKGEHKLGTPTTICAVRGTEFTMGVSKGGDSRIELTEGKLDVRNSYGRIDLNAGSSADINLTDKPEEGDIEGDFEEWKSGKDESLEDDIEDQADKYQTHIENFGERSEADATKLETIKESTKKAVTKDDIAVAGEEIAKAESENEDNMLMNEASKSSVEILKEDYGSKNQAIKDKFQSIADRCNVVQQQQLKNQQAIQKVKEEYKKAYDKIMKKFKNDKTNIFKNLEDYKKNNPMKSDEVKE